MIFQTHDASDNSHVSEGIRPDPAGRVCGLIN